MALGWGRRKTMPDEKFTAACEFVIPLGQHKGKTIARVGSNAEGLRDLDWLVGQEWIYGAFKEALQTYLKHPQIQRDLEAAIGDD
jgi:hypothetical protein